MGSYTRETWSNGQLVSSDTVTTTPEQDNADTIVQALDNAISYFSNQYANWGTATSAQKDQANRNAMRALTQICRLIRGRFDAAQ